MKLLFFSFIPLVILSSFTAYSQTNIQNQGKAVIFFESTTPVIVKLDSAKITQSRNPILLNQGKYIVTAWAPNKQLFTDTIVITEGKTTFCVHSLKNTQSYNEYKSSIKSYKLKKTLCNYIALPITAVYSGIMYSNYKANKRNIVKHFDEAQKAKTEYESAISVSNIAYYNDLYYYEKKQYENYLSKNNQIAKTSRIIIPVGLAASAVLFYMSSKLKKPVYSETPLLSVNSIYLNRCFDQDYSIGITLNINYYK